jgi:hypothetical protein
MVLADTLYHLGTVMWSNGRNAQAIAYHAEAVAEGLAELKLRRGNFWRGEALAASGKRDAAVEHLSLAAAGAEQLGRVRLTRDATDALARVTGDGGYRARASALAARIDEAARACEDAMAAD